MEMKDILVRIDYFRNCANLSVKALSLSIEKSPVYITKMEHGEYEPSMRIILDIIDACGTTLEEFFYEDLSSYKSDKETLSLLKRADNKKKAALSELLKLL